MAKGLRNMCVVFVCVFVPKAGEEEDIGEYVMMRVGKEGKAMSVKRLDPNPWHNCTARAPRSVIKSCYIKHMILHYMTLLYSIKLYWQFGHINHILTITVHRIVLICIIIFIFIHVYSSPEAQAIRRRPGPLHLSYDYI